MEQPGSASGTEQEPGSEQAPKTEQEPGSEQAPEAEQEPDPEQAPETEQAPDDTSRHSSGRSAGDDGPRAFTATAKLGAGIAVIGVVGTGMLDFALTQYGSPAAGRAVWAVGFTLTVFVLWYVILRPMEITGP